jgi:superfamily II DNA or RNA helicase
MDIDIINHYKIQIYERYRNLINSGKNMHSLDNNDLWKIFEYFSCIKLSEERGTLFYEYNDIDPNFKELNKMSRNDTGIDCCDLLNTIVQCKLRKNTLTWRDCSTFFGSQVFYNKELKKPVIRWENLVITRNNDSILSEHLLERSELFIDKLYLRGEIISFCENLMINTPEYPKLKEEKELILRDYQTEAIEIINNKDKKNSIICIPTGCGKNIIIIYSMSDNIDKKYLILVPRIILMEQFNEELLLHRPEWINQIQMIGDGNNEFDEKKRITICVYNSVGIIMNYANDFEKIYIDEAHHIEKPEIYKFDEDEYNYNYNNGSDSDEDCEENEDSCEENEDLDFDLDESSEDDSNDELKKSNYIKLIYDLSKYKNNVYLSATIDPIEGFDFYKKDIRDMIEQNYLSDYTVHIPIFNDDPTNRNICEYVLNNYKNMIIYCNSQEEGQQINDLMNSIMNKSCEYLDCNTKKSKRNDIINKFKSGNLPFLVNVRILIEGFNAPITKGVIFMHLPKASTTLIQIIGRSLRLHCDKKYSNIILPYSCNEDGDNISNFLKVMANNDKRIKKSYEKKELGGYILFNMNEEDDGKESNKNIDCEEKTNIEFKFEMVYNSMGEIKNLEEIWNQRLQDLKKYIDENKKRPKKDKNNVIVKKLHYWMTNQYTNFKNNENIMKNENIYNKWKKFIEEYSEYFTDSIKNWYNMLENVKIYINENKKRPLDNDKDIYIRKLCNWILRQINNFKDIKSIMKNKDIYKKWEEFIKDYEEYFLSNESEWNSKLLLIKNYIDTYNKLPSSESKDTVIKKYGMWILNQKNNFKNKEKIMKNENIYNKWKNFIEEYSEYFLSNVEIWYNTFDKVKLYIDKNKKRPVDDDKDINIKKLSKWISHQLDNFKDIKSIMKNENIYNKWKNFIEEYKEYFLSNEDLWNVNLNKLIKYIDENKKLPSNKDIIYKKLCIWTRTQVTNFKFKRCIMKEEIIYNKWKEFIEEYKEYFLSNEEIWYNTFNKVKSYINENKKLPLQKDIDKNVSKLASWVCMQKKNYKTREQIMKYDNIYNEWSNFIKTLSK